VGEDQRIGCTGHHGLISGPKKKENKFENLVCLEANYAKSVFRGFLSRGGLIGLTAADG